jgi:hypothetical protein
MVKVNDLFPVYAEQLYVLKRIGVPKYHSNMSDCKKNSFPNRYSLISIGVCIFLLISIIPPLMLYPKIAFGDGLFQEQLSASFGDRKADLIIKMTPPVVTTESLQNQSQKPVIQFKLYDPATKEGYKHVTYYVTIEKDGKKLLSDWFHDHKGDLKLEMKPQSGKEVTVYGEPDPILQAFTGTKDSPVVASGPIFEDGGLYPFLVRIANIDYDRSLIPDDKQPVYDGWLSVGSTMDQQVSVRNGTEQIPIQIISYYDDLKNFSFDPSKNQMQFNMPFDWNMTRLEEQKQLLVHQEVSIPKGSVLASNSYVGTINNIDVTKNLMVDPSNSTKDVIHFMLPKPAIMQIAEQVNANGQKAVSNRMMEFTLAPSTNQTSTSMSMSDMQA